MGKYDKKYEAFKLYENLQSEKEKTPAFRSESTVLSTTWGDNREEGSLQDGMYYEIEYDASPIPGVGKYVLKSQKVEPPVKDETREIFGQMRDIAREDRYWFYNSSRFYDKRVQQENARIFYKQGMYMKDFEDAYEESIPYSAYFPYYQMMGYQQLRTYFTWRTRVRRGKVADTSLSYVFLYLYELLSNIGVQSPQEGLDQLLFFWKEFRIYNESIDKYVLRWLKDYHIYYELPHSFKEFVDQNNLTAYYPKLTDSEDYFDIFCTISKYDIRKSLFYTQEKVEMIKECFYFIMDRIKMVFTEKNIDFEKTIFYPTQKMSPWTPFQGALFYPWLDQKDRQVVLSAKEIYLCSQNRWTYSRMLTTEKGKQLIGYIMKKMESVLRQTLDYRYKLTVNLSMVNSITVNHLQKAGICLESIITDAVKEFYRERTKTIVKVNVDTLAKIRQEALLIQEKLIVPEEENLLQSEKKESLQFAEYVQAQDNPFPDVFHKNTVTDPWKDLDLALSQMEKKVLVMALHGDGDIKQYADKQGIMLEVLLDGINEKAMDMIGDSLIDDDFTIYEDYIEEVKGMVE